ncbi:hypothetical protein HDU80_002245, partial [Chytriomyces hyalinus]
MEVHRSYRESIAELTFNSRPIITSLTIIAGENLAHANVIVDVIEAQLRNVIIHNRPSLFYCPHLSSPAATADSPNSFD